MGHWCFGINFQPFTWKLAFDGNSIGFWMFKSVQVGPIRFYVSCDKDDE